MNVNQTDEFNEAKIQMLQALSRSQAAIASILEQTAIVATQYQLPVSLIREQLRMLAGYQSSMITQLSGIQLKRVIRGKPVVQPWLNTKLIP